MNSREGTLVDELRDLLDAEKRLLQALPNLTMASENKPNIALQVHRDETEKQVQRLTHALRRLETPKREKRGAALNGVGKKPICELYSSHPAFRWWAA